MTNREKLSKMSLIDILMYLDECRMAIGFTYDRCAKFDMDCYKCRAAWLNEQAKGSDKHDNI